jgi:hypothetical protein
LLISFSIFELLAPAATHAKVFSDVIRNAKGEVLHVTSFSAREYCISIGMRVPTVRELAEWGQQNGALGIRESAFAGTDFVLPLQV